MIVFGRLKGERRSYRQWQENNIPPQVVFEILSESNKTSLGKKEMARKLTFYEQYGVEEYYIYDPDEFILEGWLRQRQQLIPIEQMSDWVSPRLQIRFAWHKGEELVLYRPDGERFLSFLDLEERWLTERQRANQERQRAEQAEVALKEAQRQKQILREQLREMGINPDQLNDNKN